MPTFPSWRPGNLRRRGASDLRRSRREPAGTRAAAATRPQAAHRHRKGPGGEIVNPKFETARAPVHPALRIASGQRPRRRLEKQAAEAAPSRSRTNQRRCGPNGRGQPPVVPVNQFVPLGDLAGSRRQVQGQRYSRARPQAIVRIRKPFGVLDCPARPRCSVPLRRQGQDPALLQALQHAQAGRHPVVAFRCGISRLADRLGQLVAAESREQGHGLLNIGEILRQAAAEEPMRGWIHRGYLHRAKRRECHAMRMVACQPRLRRERLKPCRLGRDRENLTPELSANKMPLLRGAVRIRRDYPVSRHGRLLRQELRAPRRGRVFSRCPGRAESHRRDSRYDPGAGARWLPHVAVWERRGGPGRCSEAVARYDLQGRDGGAPPWWRQIGRYR